MEVDFAANFSVDFSATGAFARPTKRPAPSVVPPAMVAAPEFALNMAEPAIKPVDKLNPAALINARLSSNTARGVISDD